MIMDIFRQFRAVRLPLAEIERRAGRVKLEKLEKDFGSNCSFATESRKSFWGSVHYNQEVEDRQVSYSLEFGSERVQVCEACTRAVLHKSFHAQLED